MIKHIEIKTYQFNGIDILVKIDYDKQQISLIENDANSNLGFKVKHWVFASREIKYMKGWQNILDAMSSTITTASKELEDYLKEKAEASIDHVAEVMGVAVDLIKKRNETPEPKPKSKSEERRLKIQKKK